MDKCLDFLSAFSLIKTSVNKSLHVVSYSYLLDYSFPPERSYSSLLYPISYLSVIFLYTYFIVYKKTVIQLVVYIQCILRFPEIDYFMLFAFKEKTTIFCNTWSSFVFLMIISASPQTQPLISVSC